MPSKPLPRSLFRTYPVIAGAQIDSFQAREPEYQIGYRLRNDAWKTGVIFEAKEPCPPSLLTMHKFVVVLGHSCCSQLGKSAWLAAGTPVG